MCANADSPGRPRPRTSVCAGWMCENAATAVATDAPESSSDEAASAADAETGRGLSTAAMVRPAASQDEVIAEPRVVNDRSIQRTQTVLGASTRSSTTATIDDSDNDNDNDTAATTHGRHRVAPYDSAGWL